MPSRLEPNPCPETLNENSSRALNSTDSIPEESHKKTLQPKCNQFYLLSLCSCDPS